MHLTGGAPADPLRTPNQSAAVKGTRPPDCKEAMLQFRKFVGPFATWTPEGPSLTVVEDCAVPSSLGHVPRPPSDYLEDVCDIPELGT